MKSQRNLNPQASWETLLCWHLVRDDKLSRKMVFYFQTSLLSVTQKHHSSDGVHYVAKTYFILSLCKANKFIKVKKTWFKFIITHNHRHSYTCIMVQEKDRDTANHTYKSFILQNSNAVISAGYSVQYIDTPSPPHTYTIVQIKDHNIIQ